MRCVLLVGFALIGFAGASLQAQTCRGLAPLPSGQLQAAGTGSLASGSRSLGVALVYDLPARAFGGVGLGTTDVEAFEASTVDLAATLGYQLEVGNAGQAQLCPMAHSSLQLGPNNAFESGVDRSMFGVGIGLAAGALFQVRPLLSLVPAIGVGLGHRTYQARSSAGASLFRIAETYGFAQFHMGVVVNQNLSIRPGLELPLGLDGSNPVLGLTVGYHFGR